MAIQDLQREKMQTALSMSIPDLTAIANGAQSKYGVDSLTAVMALQIKGPAEKAARAQQAAQQPKQPTVKDQVVAQASDMGGGIANLPAENVMTEQAMAAGGIVAFEEGGSVQDLTRRIQELKRMRQNIAASSGVGFRGVNPQQARIDALDEQIVQLERQLKASTPAQQPPAAAPAVAPATPAPTQQAPGAAPIGAPAGFPSVGGAFKNLRDAATAYGNFDTMQFMRNVDLNQYKDFLPMTPEAVREQMAGSRGALEQMFPEKTREEVEQRIAQRYAGLEDMFKQREARGAEAVKEAEKEKGQTAGLGLMQLAAELVSKPLTKIDPSAAFQTFKEANSQFRQARKEYREGLDKIAEARELQKIGQAEKADALFREGAMARFNFETGLDKLAIAQDSIYKTGALSIADMATKAQDRKLTANLKMGEAELGAATKGAELASEERRAAMYAGARMGGGRSALEDKAQDNAKARMDQWMKSPAGAIAMAKDPTGGVFMQMQNQFYLEELAKLQGTAAPSGGGAQPVIDFRTGKPIGQ
jgi:hypothetical protein